MNSPEAQPDPDPHKTYFDPEEPDSSEQFFSASLEQSGQKSAFVLDSEEILETHATSARKNEELDVLAPQRPSDSKHESQEVGGFACGAPESSEGSLSESASPEPDWRDLVSAKVKRYKTEKPRPERYPSLQLSFDSRPAWRSERNEKTVTEENIFSAAPEPPRALLDEIPRATVPVTTEATARVLEFPRPGMLPFNREELAEPVVDRPRIVEAPELLPPPPALGGILIAQPAQPEPERQPGLDMPLATAPLSRKIFAAAVDGIFVTTALAIFGYMFLRLNASLPPLRLSLGIGVLLTSVLWFAYQSAFVICCGRTLGLRAAGLRIRKFDGAAVPRKLRRWRVIASILSALPLGLGYAWCFFDEDELSWHDRITKTHLAPK